MNKYLRKIFLCIISVILILNGFRVNANATTSKVSRDELYKSAEKTIQWYHDNFKGKEFRGILDWPALGLFGFGEDVSGAKWTVNGKNGATWRAEEVKNGVMLSTAKNTDYQRTIIGVTSAGKNPRNFGGLDLVEIEKGTMLPNGHFADSVADNATGMPVGEDLINAHIFGIIALHTAGEPIPNRDKCLEWLEKQQNHDGGYTWDVKYFDDPEDYLLVRSDVDMTAAALMGFAILGEDESNPSVARALKFLHEQQLDNGGFHSWGTENPESNSWVIKALTLLGQDPMGEAWTKPGGGNPITAMLQFQLSDGSFTHVLKEEEMLPVYQNGMSTEQSLYGMASAYHNKCVYDMLHEKYRPEAEKNMFMDYKPGEFGFSEAMDLIYDYIITDCAGNSFKPQLPVTRTELENYIMRTLMRDFKKIHYIDKKENIQQWVEELIKEAPGGTGSADNTITGSQFIGILLKAANVDTEDETYVQTAKKMGLLYEDYDEKGVVKRAQCVWSLMQLRNIY